jgi:hypothetical protein
MTVPLFDQKLISFTSRDYYFVQPFVSVYWQGNLIGISYSERTDVFVLDQAIKNDDPPFPGRGIPGRDEHSLRTSELDHTFPQMRFSNEIRENCSYLIGKSHLWESVVQFGNYLKLNISESEIV